MSALISDACAVGTAVRAETVAAVTPPRTAGATIAPGTKAVVAPTMALVASPVFKCWHPAKLQVAMTTSQ